MKHKTQITAILLLVCILLTPALTSSASAHDYDHVYNDITIITPDSFEDVFGVTEVDRAAYTYQMVELNNSKAVVALEMELKVGHDYYSTVVSGTVNTYTLPSGDTLYEGPIDGIMNIGEEEYRVTIGFTKLENTDDTMITTTIQGDSTMIVMCFGDDVIQGEVLDWFTERSESTQGITTNENTTEDVYAGEIDAHAGETLSPLMIGDGFAPIFNPGDSGGSYPSFDGGAHQSRRTCYYDDPQYSAMQSNVYWKQNSNLLTVTIKPRSRETASYYNTTTFGTYGPVSVILYSAASSLKLDVEGMNTTDSTKGLIKNTSFPDADDYTINCDIPGFGRLLAIFEDILLEGMSLSNELTELLSSLFGKVYTAEDNDAFYRKYTVEFSPLNFVNLAKLDDTETLAFGYYLEQEVPSEYTGNTYYEAKAYITYCVFVEIPDFTSTTVVSYVPFYFTHETTHQGSVYIMP